MTERKSTPPRTSPPATDKPLTGHPRKTGARRSPHEKLKEAPKYQPKQKAPDNFGIVPSKLSMWGNSQYGCCVTTEEAFAKACEHPEVFIAEQAVIFWAAAHDVRDGADLVQVLDMFRSDGFAIGQQKYDDGPHATVDFANPDTLAAAICEGVVKIALDSSALPPTAGNQQGWYSVGGTPGRYSNTDHCIGLSGQGSADYLFGLIGVAKPSDFVTTKKCFLAFTWSTMGVVDFDWVASTIAEAHLRTPTTVYDPPIGPPPPPPPPPPSGQTTITLSTDMQAGAYQIGGTTVPADDIRTLIAELQKMLPAQHPANEMLLKAKAIGLTPAQWQALLALLLNLIPNVLPIFFPPKQG